MDLWWRLKGSLRLELTGADILRTLEQIASQGIRMEEKEYSNVYAIPANYTDSGKLFGGMVETRNAVEAVFLVILVGYPELMWIPMSTTIRIVVMTVTLLPLAVVSFMGIDGDSLLQYLGHIILFWFHRRKLHFRRIGYKYDPKQLKKPGRKGKKKKARKA